MDTVIRLTPQLAATSASVTRDRLPTSAPTPATVSVKTLSVKSNQGTDRTPARNPTGGTLWLLHQQAAQNTRRTKAQSRRTGAGQVRATEPTEDERLAAWEAQITADEMAAASLVWQEAEQFAREHGPAGAPPRATLAPGSQPTVLPPVPDRVLSESEKARAARVAVASVLGSRVLAVKGRISGQWRTTWVNLLTFGGRRYLVAPRGETQWVRNLRDAGSGPSQQGESVVGAHSSRNVIAAGLERHAQSGSGANPVVRHDR